jgi:PAS domain S-box-containing protein
MDNRYDDDDSKRAPAPDLNVMQALERIASRSIAESSESWLIDASLKSERQNDARAKPSLPSNQSHDTASPSAIFAGTLDDGYKITEINDSALEFIGASREDILGLPFPETAWWKSSADRKRLGEALAQARNGKPDSFESFHEGAQGQGLRALFTTLPIHSHGYFAIAVVGIDITAKRAQEDAEAKSEKAMRMFFENNSSVMILIEPETGTIVDANASACSYYGYERDALRALKISDINTMPEEQLARERALAASQKRNYFIFSHRLSNGAIRQVEIHSCPVENAGRKLLLTIVHDISARIDPQGASTSPPPDHHESEFAIGDRIRMAMADSARLHAFNAVIAFDFSRDDSSEDALALFDKKLKTRLSPLDTVVRGRAPFMVAILCKLSSDRRHAEQKAALLAEMAIAESGIASAKAGICIFSNQGNPFESAKSALVSAREGTSVLAFSK